MDCQHVRWSMRMKHIAAVIVVTAVLLFTQTYTSARGAEYKIPQRCLYIPELRIRKIISRRMRCQTQSEHKGKRKLA